MNLKEADDPRLAIVDSNLERQAVANYPVIRPSVSRVIRIIVGASVEINLYQFTAAMVHSNGCWWNWFSLPGDKSYPSTGDLPSRGGGGGGSLFRSRCNRYESPSSLPAFLCECTRGSKYLRGRTKYRSSNRDEAASSRDLEHDSRSIISIYSAMSIDWRMLRRAVMRVDLPLCTLFHMEAWILKVWIHSFFFFFFFSALSILRCRHDRFRMTFVK